MKQKETDEKMELDLFSEALGRREKLDVLITGQECRTLIMLHGLHGCRHDWLQKTGLAELAGDHKINVICPDGGNDFYVNSYMRYISFEIPEFLEKEMHLGQFAIGGLSMGGYGAMINAFTFPKRFSHVIALSAAMPVYKCRRMLEEGDKEDSEYVRRLGLFGPFDKMEGGSCDPIAAAKKAEKSGIPPLFIACGREDDHIGDTRRFIEALSLTSVDYTYVENRGRHDWQYWDRMLIPSLKWLEGR